MAKGEVETVTAVSLNNLQSILFDFLKEYNKKTPKRLKIIDTFCIFLIIVGALQFGYFLIVGDFPRNSLLSGLFAPLGTMILTVCLRFQVNKETKYLNITDERAFFDYFICLITLYLAIVNFLG